MVGFPAGSSPDFVARLLALHLKDYAPALLVDNRPGAGGRLPLELLNSGERDGSLMAITPGDQVALFPHVYAKLGTTPCATLPLSRRYASCSSCWSSGP